MSGATILKGLPHVAIKTADLAQARRFYLEVLGLQNMPRPDFGYSGADVAAAHAFSLSIALAIARFFASWDLLLYPHARYQHPMRRRAGRAAGVGPQVVGPRLAGWRVLAAASWMKRTLTTG